MAQDIDLLYLGRNRLHRSRANLIQTLHTCQAWRRMGLRVELALPPWPRTLSLEQVFADVGIRLPPSVVRSSLLHPRWKFWPYVWWNRARLRAAPVVYTREPRIALACADAGVRCHLEIHNAQSLQEEGLMPRVCRLHQLNRIGWLIPISRSAASLLRQAGALDSRMVIAPSGVELDDYQSIDPFDPAKLDRPRILYLGRLSKERGLEVFRRLRDENIAELHIVGGEESLPGAFNHPFSPPSQAPQWHGRCELVLLPYQPSIGIAKSISPIKLFEAMAAGRPIIASNLPTLAEILVHEHNALLVEPDDWRGWIDAVRRLQADRALAVRIAAAAKAQAPRYSWDARASTIAQAIGLHPPPHMPQPPEVPPSDPR